MTHGTRLRRLSVLLALVFWLPCGAALAQPAPGQPIRLLVGFPPGGGVDLVARPLAQRLSDRLGQPVVVENRPGANGSVAGEAIARGTPDGRLFMVAASSMLTVNPALYRSFPFDPLRDIAPVAQLVVTPLVMAVPASLGVQDLASFVALARARPGALNMGSSGNGVLGHLVLEQLNALLGIDIVHVPYRGLAPALQDLLAGRIQLMVEVYGPMRGAAEGGQLRVLAVTSPRRVPDLPIVPTVAEALTLPDFQATGFMGVVAPPGTPPAMIAQMQDAIGAVMRDTDLPQIYAAQGLLPAFAGADAMRGAIERDLRRWGAIIGARGITAD